MPSNLDQYSDNVTGPFKDNTVGAIGADDMRAFAATVDSDLDLLESGKERKLFLNVKDYGAVGDGTTDDTAEIQAALTDVPVIGAVVYFPAGEYLVTGNLTCVNPVTIKGVGAGTYESGGSRILCASTTENVLTISSPGSAIIGMCFENTAVTDPSAGSALVLTDFDFGHIDRCMFIGFYKTVHVSSGFFYTVSNSMFLRPINVGLWLENTATNQYDHGDMYVNGCTFSPFGRTTNGGTAILWQSGGGLRLEGCKINGATQPGYPSTAKFTRGIDINTNIAVGSTSVIHIVGNSLEGCLTDIIRLTSTSGGVSKVTIVGNGIDICATGVNIVSGAIVQISDNIFTDLDYGITIAACDGLNIGTNIFVSTSVPINMSGTAYYSTHVAQQNVRGDNLVLVYDNNVANTVQGAFGQARWDFQREIPATPSSVTYVGDYKFLVPSNAGGIFTFTLSGFVTGVGGFTYQGKRAWIQGTGGSTPSLTTIGTDVAVGAAVDVEFLTAAGNITLHHKLNAGGGGTNITGRCSLVIEGPIYQVRKGT
jgi:hypothetical protein